MKVDNDRTVKKARESNMDTDLGRNEKNSYAYIVKHVASDIAFVRILLSSTRARMNFPFNSRHIKTTNPSGGYGLDLVTLIHSCELCV